MTGQNRQKSLSEVFRELERDKNIQVQKYQKDQKLKEELSFFYHVKQRTKKDNIILVLIVLVLLFVVSLFSRNYIFAVNVDDGPKNAVGTFEKNEDPRDVYSILSENMSNLQQKEIFDIEQEIEFETEYISNKDMPDGETVTIQEGFPGSKIVTYVTSYENGSPVEQNSIGEVMIAEPQNEIIEIGTSQVLKEYNVHIGDSLYASNESSLKKTININADEWLIIPRYYDVKLLEIIDESWFKVSYNNKNTGYIPVQYLTSETLSPGISEISRKTKIVDKVDINMDLGRPSGMLLSDYERILSNQPSDVNNVFKDNYMAFYDAEQRYGINGIFLASIAIHESGWGTSTISLDKYNLFGFGAYDGSAYQSSVTFSSYAEGIDTVAHWLTSNYLYPAGTVLRNGEVASGRYYNGTSLGAVNVRYASDQQWANKVFRTMQNLYSEL